MNRFIQYLLFYTILGANFCFGMSSSSTQNIDDDGDQSSSIYESDDDLFQHLRHPNQSPSNTTNLVYPHQLSDTLKKKFETYFQDLPSELKKSILAFKKAHELGKNDDFLINILIFTGEPGTGKSTAAKAIAYKLGWPYLFIDCASLGDTYQNSAIVHLREKIQPLIAANKPCVIIFDEMSTVSKQEKDVRNENNEMHKIRHEINALLDQIEDRKNILFIGTTNHINVVSDAICSRSDIVFFKKLTPAQKVEKFEELLTSFNIKLELQETTWNTLKENTADYDLRDIQRLASRTRTNAWARSGYTDGKIIVKDKDILSALKYTSTNKALVKAAKNEKSEHQKMHEETLAQSAQFHNEQAELAKDLTKQQIDASTMNTFFGFLLNKTNCNLL